MKKYIFIFYLACLFPLSIWAQKTKHSAAQPINLESFIGNKGLMMNVNFSKPIAPNSRFGIFSLGEYYGTYKTKDQANDNQYMAQTHLTYALFKNLAITGGFILNQVDGLRPTLGIQYALKEKDFLFFVNPRADLTQTHNLELMGLVEYNPELQNNWGIYSRIQGLYNRDAQHGFHAFSYLRLRVGMSYKVYRFGIGGNLTTMGPEKIRDNQIGLFAGMLFF